MAVDQSQLGGRHAELRPHDREAQVAADGELEPAAEAVPVDGREHRVGCAVIASMAAWNG